MLWNAMADAARIPVGTTPVPTAVPHIVVTLPSKGLARSTSVVQSTAHIYRLPE
jgi:hypothetical protein